MTKIVYIMYLCLTMKQSHAFLLAYEHTINAICKTLCMNIIPKYIFPYASRILWAVSNYFNLHGLKAWFARTLCAISTKGHLVKYKSWTSSGSNFKFSWETKHFPHWGVFFYCEAKTQATRVSWPAASRILGGGAAAGNCYPRMAPFDIMPGLSLSLYYYYY